MTIKNFFAFIWNGGLDPAGADPGELRQRRTLSTTSFLLIPVAFALIIANFTVYDAAVNNLEVGTVLVLGLSGLALQAYKGWDRFAAILLVASIWFASTSNILREGFSSENWVWMTTAVLIAILVTTRMIAFIYTGIVIITLLTFAAMTDYGYLKTGLVLEKHAISVAISGSLNFVIMCVVGFAFRTNQIETEQMLNANVKRLDREVATRRRAEREALAGKRAKNTFLTTISHELRTPLNGVIGAGELLADSPLNAEQRELVDVVTHSGEDLLDLINNVLDLSRLEAGRLELESKPFHLRSAIESCMAPLLEQGHKKNVSVSYEIARNLPDYVLGDAVRLQQIVKNLCDNALKFTESGRIELNARNFKGELQLTVTDTGIGIAEETKADLFQPFTQALTSDDQHVAGTGLGLTIVAELVSLLGGTLNLRSELGTGSVFTITLPLLVGEPPIEQINNKNESPKLPLSAYTVLVADDNSINRQIASKMLTSLNCKVMEAADGIETIKILRHNKIDMVMMDIRMPRMDGLEATRAIRALPDSIAQVPIIGLTANWGEIDTDRLLAAGMDDCIAKPIRQERLERLLSEVTYGELSPSA